MKSRLCLWSDEDWAQFCSIENDSSTTTTTVSIAEEITISVNPPPRLLEVSLTKLSHIVKLSTHLCLTCIRLNDKLDYHLVSTVCEALLHRKAQQKVQVEFRFNRVTYEQFLPVANLMKNCKREIGFDIRIREIQDDGVSGLFADTLRHLACAVTGLIIDSRSIGVGEARALAENLMANTTLASLTLLDNEIGDKGAEALASALKHNGTLTKLSLGQNRIGKKGGVAIGHALLCNRTLEMLALSFNAICDEGAMALAAGLRGGSSLKVLRVDDARIGKKGGVALGEALAFSSMLSSLDIRGNFIGDEGTIAIASSLVRNATLKMLDVASVGMRTEGCSALARALRSNTSLTHITISENQIGGNGAAALADALIENTSLKKLRMQVCDINDSGAIALAEAIASNETLESLSLWCSRDVLTAFENGLNYNSTLTDFFPYAGNAGIEFALRRNKALLKEHAWMKRFSDQDVRLKGKALFKAMERYSRSEFTELTFLLLKSQVSTIAETNGLTHPTHDK